MAKEKKSTPAEEVTSSPSAQRLRETRHYFPEANLTITADSREEAEKEVARILKEEAADSQDQPAENNKEEEDK